MNEATFTDTYSLLQSPEPKKQEETAREERPGIRRSVRESRKVFNSLNEHSLVRSLVGDYLVKRQPRRDSQHRQLLDEGEFDSQEEVIV